MSADDFGKFTTTITSGDSTFTVDGQCTPDGIVLLDTTYTGAYGSSTIAAVTNSGVTVPKESVKARRGRKSSMSRPGIKVP